MRLKVVGTLAAMLLLAACSSDSNTGSSAAGTGAQTGAGNAGASSAAQRPLSLQERLVAEIGDRVFFDFDKSDLKPEERRRIERFRRLSGRAGIGREAKTLKASDMLALDENVPGGVDFGF